MKSSTPVLLCALLLLNLSGVTHAADRSEWSGVSGYEFRYFADAPLDPRQHGNNSSLKFEPQYYRSWDDGSQSFLFTPFLRVDEGDDDRSHADIRELSWIKATRDWELRLGLRKVFWGVTESQHLVDIINQSDLLENPDGEDKLGQPMLNLALIRDWGTVDLFVLPYFRERLFPGIEGRLRTPLPVDTDNPIYESSRREKHVDWAMRWSHTVDIWDFGLSHFSGTSRDPRFIPALDATAQPVLRPVYDLINQTGLDAQATIESWLWKLEVIRRSGQGEAYYAATGGLEYTFYGIFNSVADVGLVAEYLWDERGDKALTPFADDVMVGLRFTLNDTQSSEALLGVIHDLDNDERVFSIEASRRVGSHWKALLEARFYRAVENGSSLAALRKDDYLQIEAEYYF